MPTILVLHKDNEKVNPELTLDDSQPIPDVGDFVQFENLQRRKVLSRTFVLGSEKTTFVELEVDDPEDHHIAD